MTQFSRLFADRVRPAGVALAVGVWTAAAPLAALAQDENPNLVKNPSFEEVDFKRLKNPGMFAELQADWYPANLTPLDVFAPGVKNLKISVPSNMYGMQEASEGQSYIGFRAYSKDPKHFAERPPPLFCQRHRSVLLRPEGGPKQHRRHAPGARSHACHRQGHGRDGCVGNGLRYLHRAWQ